MMKNILLKIEGRQSWGISNRMNDKFTIDFPTMSGICGLIHAACGVYEEKDIVSWKQLNQIDITVLIIENGIKEKDFQTAQGIRNLKNSANVKTIFYKHYLSDASFLVAIKGEDAMIDRIFAGFQKPANPLYVGRKCCKLGYDFLYGVFEEEDSTKCLIRAYKEIKKDKTKDFVQIVEKTTENTEFSEFLQDVPAENKQFNFRKIKREWISTCI